MTVRVDYTQLGQPAIRLTLHHSRGGYYSVTDQHGHLYFPPTQDLDLAVRFMRAMEAKRDALINEASVERATWHSVKVPEPSNVIPLRRTAG